jgi:hypothetical protein
MAKNNKKAKKMASQGASVKEIRQATGVNRAAAQKFTQRSSSSSSLPPAANGQFPSGNTTSRTNPKNTSTSRSTPEIKGLGQGIRLAGADGLSKSNYNTLAETTGKSDDKIIGKLDKINSRLAEKGKAGINLSSGAANMLIKKGQKNRDQYRGFAPVKPAFGEGAIGSTLQSMLSTPERPGTWLKGHLTGGREALPGFNPGGHPDKNRMIGGTVIRGNGEIANKGFGEQYKKSKKLRGDKEFGPYDGMEIGPPDLDGPGPLANPNTDTWLENQTGDGDGDEITTGGDGDLAGTTGPEGGEDNSASSGAGGLDLASWATGFKKARSARQKSGRDAQGISSQKKNPFKSWA